MICNKQSTAKPNSGVASQPCPSGHITADIRLRFAPPKCSVSPRTSYVRSRYVPLVRLERLPADRREMRKIHTEEIKQVVKSRYSKFAETGGHKEPC